MVTEPRLAPVLVPVARTATGAGVRVGAAEAVRAGRPLHVVHVVPPAQAWLQRAGREAVADAMRLAQAEVGERVSCDGDLIHGDVVGLLRVRAATSALVVLERPDGRHPDRPPTAVRLAEILATPTLVVPAAWESTHHGVVSVGLDPAAVDDSALRTAVLRARQSGSLLRVVVSGDDARGEVERRLAGLGDDACEVAVEIGTGPPVEALLLAAASSDLVVLGRHPAPSRAARLASGVGRRLVQALPCPVLLPAPGHVHDDRMPPARAETAGARR
jgi:nucleotide-binding universal stress UspA family protein